jgi:hypothetical protein
MAEKIVSPGVFTKEVDQSFLPAGVAAIGAAVIGPTAKGPAGIPTIVSSYSEYLQHFGGKIESGSGAQKNQYKYLTDYAAQEYLKYADTLTVVRILADGYSKATSIISSSTSVGVGTAVGSLTMLSSSLGTDHAFGVEPEDEVQITSAGTEYRFITADPAGGIPANSSPVFYLNTGSTTAGYLDNLVSAIDSAAIGVDAVDGTTFLGLSASSAGTGGNGISVDTGSGATFSSVLTLAGGTNSTTSANSLTLTTLADGVDQNSSGPESTNNLLLSGSSNNVRWEIQNVSNSKGTFNLLIRRGSDTSRRKIILEQWNNLTLDPNTSNYVARVLGDQYYTLADAGQADPYLQLSGDYPNKSKYVRVTVHDTTFNYLDENGNVRDGALSGSLPSAGSGSFFGGSDGGANVSHPIMFNENISDTNTQGFNLGTAAKGGTAYSDAIKLLKNQDEYDFNLLTMPGLVDNLSNHATYITEALNMCEDRADCFFITDPVEHGAALASATTKAEARDSNYAAEYWPWIKIPDNDLGRNVWVPASTLIPSVYAFNDRVAAPWFAPAGLNRGGIDIAVQTERKLTHANRDTLYESNVNPIATFPNAGVTVFGQKTLQKKASALDRVNVRRLLIAAKKFIASTTKFLIFENNTAATRNRFLGIVNPWMENVQQRQGLYAFKVVMDESNNTPDVIDRNQMVGQIFLQPAKAAEFIIIDFNILPTGAAFPE